MTDRSAPRSRGADSLSGCSAPADSARPSSKGLRTCVGCRGKDRPVALLRVVADSSSGAPGPSGVTVLVPDARRRLPGRGAWIHRHDECLRLAERRRAFHRALRLAAGRAVDIRQVEEYLNPGPPGLE